MVIFFEIWVKSFELGLYKTNSFDMHEKCNDEHRVGGVVVYLQECYQNVSINIELCTKEAVNFNPSLFLSVLVVYCLHSYSINNFLNKFSSIIDIFNDSNLIIVGDISISTLKSSLERDTCLIKILN